MEKTQLELWLEKTWADYQSDDYTDFGKLNLVAAIGEKGGRIIALLTELRAQNERLAQELVGARQLLENIDGRTLQNGVILDSEE